MNIKNSEVARLAAEIAAMTGESKTQAVRRALEERWTRLAGRHRPRQMIPAGYRSAILTPAEVEELLGYGPKG